MEPGSIPEIERMIVKHQPRIVIIDQIRNLKSKEDNRVLQLEQMAAAVRQLGELDHRVPGQVHVVAAQLGEDAGLLGAAYTALERAGIRTAR